MRKQHILSIAVAACMLAPTAGFATNGYFSHGYGTKNKGLGGSGVAMPQDSLAAATNPAGSVWVGDRADLGMAFFMPDRGYSVTGNPSGAPAFGLIPGNYDSENGIFAIPHFGWNTMLTPDSSFGVSVYGNGGMNTEYENNPPPMNGPFYGGTTGVDLMQLFANINYSRKWSDNSSWGVGLILAAQSFEARGLTPSFAGMVADGNADDLSDNGHDMSYGAGIKLGLQSQLTDRLSVGASYQSRTWMTEFDDYSDLFADGGDFDIPPTATIGLTFKPAAGHAINLDIQRIWYSDVDSVSNPMSNLTNGCMAGVTSQCLGGDDGVGFGWNDMTIYKLGWQWQMRDDFTLRLGWNYAKQPIDSSEVMFNILAPGVIEHHYTIGFTAIPLKGHELNFAAMYAPNVTVDGTNPLDPAQTIELEMDQVEFELSWAWVF